MVSEAWRSRRNSLQHRAAASAPLYAYRIRFGFDAPAKAAASAALQMEPRCDSVECGSLLPLFSPKLRGRGGVPAGAACCAPTEPCYCGTRTDHVVPRVLSRQRNKVKGAGEDAGATKNESWRAESARAGSQRDLATTRRVRDISAATKSGASACHIPM